MFRFPPKLEDSPTLSYTGTNVKDGFQYCCNSKYKKLEESPKTWSSPQNLDFPPKTDHSAQKRDDPPKNPKIPKNPQKPPKVFVQRRPKNATPLRIRDFVNLTPDKHGTQYGAPLRGA